MLNIYGFHEKGLNKDGLNKYGYKKSSGRGLNIISSPILLSKIYTNNSSKELINEIKKLVKNLYKNKQITKQVYNIRKNIFACLFSVHNTISLSRHEQVCIMRLRFERYFSHHREKLMGEVSLET